MKVAFCAYVNYGYLESVDYEVEVELTKEEYARVRNSAEEYMRMSEDESIADIYQKVYQAALQLDLKVMREDKSALAEKMEAYLKIPYADAFEREYSDEEIIDMLEHEGSRGIGYPEEFEE